MFTGHYLPQQTAASVYTDMPLVCVKGKGKAVPLQAWTGPEGS